MKNSKLQTFWTCFKYFHLTFSCQLLIITPSRLIYLSTQKRFMLRAFFLWLFALEVQFKLLAKISTAYATLRSLCVWWLIHYRLFFLLSLLQSVSFPVIFPPKAYFLSLCSQTKLFEFLFVLLAWILHLQLKYGRYSTRVN